MIIYKVDVLQELKKAGYNTNRLQKDKIIFGKTIQALKNNKMIGINALDKICEITKKQPGYFIAFVSDPEKQQTQ